MTINKAQGQSLQVYGLNFENPCFLHGQMAFLYSTEGITKNIVYPNRTIEKIPDFLIGQSFPDFCNQAKIIFTTSIYAFIDLDKIKIYKNGTIKLRIKSKDFNFLVRLRTT
ncbi:ATP-dependent DNA helicase PIF6-like [Aphis craccivora]|uniref:ATP-dependent DNA helicase PIF6-like n=1 Tax=Aphis craccivora TaxID=307492 RepID=A0A6G0Z2X3_APHCR|nr:ATP-dependent DNA helicase PIF6-like [Aphis craccivora]